MKKMKRMKISILAVIHQRKELTLIRKKNLQKVERENLLYPLH